MLRALVVRPDCSSAKLTAQAADDFFVRFFIEPNRLDGLLETTGICLLFLVVALVGGMPTPGGLAGALACLLYITCAALQCVYSILGLMSYIKAGVSFSEQHKDCMTQWKHGNSFYGLLAYGAGCFHPVVLLWLSLVVLHTICLARAIRVACAAKSVHVPHWLPMPTFLSEETFHLIGMAYPLISFIFFFCCSLSILFALSFVGILVSSVAGVCILFGVTCMVGLVIQSLVGQKFTGLFDDTDEAGDHDGGAEGVWLLFYMISPFVVWGMLLTLYIYAGDGQQEQLAADARQAYNSAPKKKGAKMAAFSTAFGGIKAGADVINDVYLMYFRDATFDVAGLIDLSAAGLKQASKALVDESKETVANPLASETDTPAAAAEGGADIEANYNIGAEEEGRERLQKSDCVAQPHKRQHG
eukprot:g2011.t1